MSIKQYLLDTEIRFSGDEPSESFIKAQCVSEPDAHAGIEMGLAVLETIYDASGKLTQVTEITKKPVFGPDWYTEAVTSGKQQWIDCPVNKPYEFIPDAAGINHLGGEVPVGFVMPKSSDANTFQYLGMLNCEDRAFKDLIDFDMHLVAPIFTNFYEGMWLDYADPNAPYLMNGEAVHDEYPDIIFESDSEIVFAKTPFSTKAWPSPSHDGRSGVAEWVQGPYFPTCPKTGEDMKLICQLSYKAHNTEHETLIPNTIRHNIKFDHGKDYSDSIAWMDFWGWGTLYIFYSPTAKISYSFIQST